MRPGPLSYQKGDVTTSLIVSGGYLEVTDNRVIILAETAEFLHEVDRDRAEKAKAKAEAILLKTEINEEEFKEAQDDLFRAIALIDVFTHQLHLSLVTPEKQVVSEDVDQVNVPGSEGDLGILLDHAPLITNMRPGPLSYQKGDVTTSLIVSGGYLEVTDNRVIILAETAEFLHEVDRDRAEKAKAKAEAILLKTEINEEEFKEAQDDLFRAIARLEHTDN